MKNQLVCYCVDKCYRDNLLKVPVPIDNFISTVNLNILISGGLVFLVIKSQFTTSTNKSMPLEDYDELISHSFLNKF